jgi:uncharacterized membrane protein YfcA
MWRRFQLLMIAVLSLLVVAEMWRFFTVHNDHAAIDGVLCAYIGAWTIRDCDPGAEKKYLAAVLLLLGIVMLVMH